MADEPKIPTPQTRDPELERAGEWWRAHGKPIVAGITIGLAAVIGFNYWQSHQETQAIEASRLYERMRVMLEIVAYQNEQEEDEAAAEAAQDDGDSNSDGDEDGAENETADADDDGNENDGDEDEDRKAETVAAINELAEQLMADYDGTPYAVHAAFSLAKFSVDAGDLERAAEVLEWAVDNTGDDDGVLHIARVRLAMVWLALGESESVVALLENQDGAGFAARYYELLGDAHLLNGDANAAARAYQHSLASQTENSVQRDLLKLKVDNLGE